jgi:hypothetical protein
MDYDDKSRIFQQPSAAKGMPVFEKPSGWQDKNGRRSF